MTISTHSSRKCKIDTTIEKIKFYKDFKMKGFGKQPKPKKKKAVETNSQLSKEKIITKAINLHLEGKISEASKYYQYCVKQGFNDHRIFSNYGLILSETGKLEEAAFITRKAIKIQPNFANAHFNLGIILKDLGKLKDAEISQRKAIKINPDFANAHCNLGIILRDLGNLKDAEISQRKAIQLEPNLVIAHCNLGSVLSDLGKLEEAELATRKAIQVQPNYANAHFNLGLILKDLSKLEEAELATRKAIEIDPNLANAYSHLGMILRDRGKLKDAEISQRKAIEINPDFDNAHCNLGIILRDLGKLKDAEISQQKAIEINPNFANAHCNLGIILRDLGNLKDAEISQRKAIGINPNFANAHCNLGIILRDLGNLKDAEISQRKAIEINPNFPNAYYNLGNILKDLDKSKEALDFYLKTIEINPNFSNIYTALTRLLKDSDPSQLDKSKLKNILNLLLERNDVSHSDLFKTFKFLYKKQINIEMKELNSYLSSKEILIEDKIIFNALKKMIFKDIKLEKLLTKIRKYILDRITQKSCNLNQSELEFSIALAEQCFLNEYVYQTTREESKSIEIIIDRCRESELNEATLSVLACYLPLYELKTKIPKLKNFTSTIHSFEELKRLQLSEPVEEKKLSTSIRSIGSIIDITSKKVKSQYEENPYPRWRYGSASKELKISFSQAINNEINPNFIKLNIFNQKLKVLIAGCGTGHQILHTHNYKNAQLTCIDLSLSSLAYAKRKLNEIGINNVELIQMDLLEVGLIKKQFDIISCSGVLHHIHDPLKGLKALLGVLKTDGFMKLGLYSELARQDVKKARDYIAKNRIESNKQNIRDFRQKIIADDLKDMKSLTTVADFYSLSECRDLCFHAQEHRFTIQEIKNAIESNHLKFLGFGLPRNIKNIYKKYYPTDPTQTNLQNWEQFEKEFPNTFRSMYQFWIKK